MKVKYKLNDKGKGITLVALVVTIVVLLILAGISITALTGDNSIIKSASTAKKETIKAQYIEILQEINVKAKNFSDIKPMCEDNTFLDNSTYLEYPEEKMLIVRTKDNYQFLVTENDVVETGYIDISKGSCKIYPDYFEQNGEKILYDGKNFLVMGTTESNTLEINGDSTNTYNITINNLEIKVGSVNDACAFNIKEGANVNLNLMGESFFQSAAYYAGLQKSSREGTLTIDGTGKIKTNGGTWAAGIGGGTGSYSSCTNIIINNGTIEANSGNLGPGIGSGNNGSAIVDNIQINGGNITAKGINAGIGSSRTRVSVSNIKITGGKLNIQSIYENSGIGGKDLKNIEITGGTAEISSRAVKPAIGCTSSIEDLNITGGNINLYTNGSIVVGTNSTEILPTNEDGDNVLRTEIILNGVNKELPINKIEFENYSGTYGLNDMYTNKTGKIYLYLPAGAKVKKVVADGETYSGQEPIEAGSSGSFIK